MRPDPQIQFESIYNSASDSVLAYVLRRIDRETALDVVAETWLIAWRRRTEIPKNSLPWLLGVARKVLANHRRSNSRRDSLLEKLSHRPLEESSLTESMSSMDFDGTVAQILQTLSSSDQEILCLVAWEGLRPKEAAQVMGYSASIFSVRLHRARKKFINALDSSTHCTREQAEAGHLRSRDEI